MGKTLRSIDGYNRQVRRNTFSDFKDMAKQSWSEWEEVDFKAESVMRRISPIKPTGSVRMVKNNRYSVQFFHHTTEWGEVVQLLVRRHDEKPVRSWADMQRVKDELAGADATAIEVFPSKKNLIDQANCYHLWVLPKDFEFPFGLHFKGWSK